MKNTDFQHIEMQKSIYSKTGEFPNGKQLFLNIVEWHIQLNMWNMSVWACIWVVSEWGNEWVSEHAYECKVVCANSARPSLSRFTKIHTCA